VDVEALGRPHGGRGALRSDGNRITLFREMEMRKRHG
jgi:hypothetical protein